MEELQAVSAKFHSHFMTKMNKQLKADKAQLEKSQADIVICSLTNDGRCRRCGVCLERPRIKNDASKL